MAGVCLPATESGQEWEESFQLAGLSESRADEPCDVVMRSDPSDHVVITARPARGAERTVVVRQPASPAERDQVALLMASLMQDLAVPGPGPTVDPAAPPPIHINSVDAVAWASAQLASLPWPVTNRREPPGPGPLTPDQEPPESTPQAILAAGATAGTITGGTLRAGDPRYLMGELEVGRSAGGWSAAATALFRVARRPLSPNANGSVSIGVGATGWDRTRTFKNMPITFGVTFPVVVQLEPRHRALPTLVLKAGPIIFSGRQTFIIPQYQGALLWTILAKK